MYFLFLCQTTEETLRTARDRARVIERRAALCIARHEERGERRQPPLKLIHRLLDRRDIRLGDHGILRAAREVCHERRQLFLQRQHALSYLRLRDECASEPKDGIELIDRAVDRDTQ